jgi:L-iditol 2-dehydrogenase
MPPRDPAPPGLPTRVVASSGGSGTRLESRVLPAPARGELVFRTLVSGLCGTDLFKLANGTAPAGMVLGHEVVGVVETLGPDTTGFEIGDRVVVPHHVPCGSCPLCERQSGTLCPGFRENLLEPGGFSERVLVRERAARLAARKVPAEIKDETAVFLEPAACVERGISRAGLQSGGPRGKTAGSVVVLGAGSMGLLHLLVLKAEHPHLRVVVSDSVEERRSFAKRLGAEEASPPGEATASAVRKITDRLGADLVFDTVGGSPLLRDALALTREGGTVVLFAHARAEERADFEINDLFKHERRVIGTYSSTLAEQETIYKLMLSGRLDPSPLATHRLPLSRFEEGVELARARRALKVLFVPDG